MEEHEKKNIKGMGESWIKLTILITCVAALAATL